MIAGIMREKKSIVNVLNMSELSGAFGDVGMLLPLLFAFVIYNGYSHRTLFLVFGAVYIITGYWFKAPVAVQPLKVIAVAAVAHGYTSTQLADTALFFGIVFIFLSWAGLLKWLQRLFTDAVVCGLQVGLGMLLAERAMALAAESGFFLGQRVREPLSNLAIMMVLILLIGYFQIKRKFPLSVLLIFGSIAVFAVWGLSGGGEFLSGRPFLQLHWPQWEFFPDCFIFLILPQLPLTIGNSIYTAADTCRRLLPERCQRVTPGGLGWSVGVSNIFAGLLGGFPLCHGSGGMAAHYMFGGRTGGATMFMGSLLVVCALWPALADLLFFIPIPLLAALLFFTGYSLILFIRHWQTGVQLAVIALTAVISVFLKNLLLAVAAGYVLERLCTEVFKLGGGEKKTDS